MHKLTVNISKFPRILHEDKCEKDRVMYILWQCKKKVDIYLLNLAV